MAQVKAGATCALVKTVPGLAVCRQDMTPDSKADEDAVSDCAHCRHEMPTVYIPYVKMAGWQSRH